MATTQDSQQDGFTPPRGRPEAVAFSPINVLAVADHQDNHFLAWVLDIADDAIVLRPVAPQALLVSMEHLSHLAGILRGLHSFPKVANNIGLRLAAQLAHLLFGGPAELNVPSQGAAPSLPG